MDPLKKLLASLPRLHSPTGESTTSTERKRGNSGSSISSPFTRQSQTSTPIPFSEPAVGRVRPPVSHIATPERIDILRYRQHNGVNLSGIFVLDKTLFPDMFTPECEGDTELDAVKAHVQKYGVGATTVKWESHWRDTMKRQDWTWLKGTAKVTTVRIPIGFYTLGKAWCTGTEFEPVAEVYANAWKYFKNFIKLALENDIGVLVVLQAVPGGFGKKTYKCKGLQTIEVSAWTTPKNLSLTIRCLVFMASQIVTSRILNSTIVGIQPIDTPPRSFLLIEKWYQSVLNAINVVYSDLPIYLNDSGDYAKARDFAKRHASSGPQKSGFRKARNPIYIEIRRNYRNNDKYGNLKPNELLECVRRSTEELKTDIGFVVGEWGSTFAGGIAATHFQNNFSGLEKFREAFVNLQVQRYRVHRGCSGGYFFTYTMDRMPGHPVGYRSAFIKGLIPLAPAYFSLPSPQVQRIASEIIAERAVLLPRTAIFEQAVDVGIRDAAAFFRFRSEFGPGADFVAVGSEQTWARKQWECYAKIGGLTEDQMEFEDGIIEGLQIWKREAVRRVAEFYNLRPVTADPPPGSEGGFVF